MIKLSISGVICLFLLIQECYAQRPAIRREIRAWRQAQKQYLPLSVHLRSGATQFWGELNHRNMNRTYGAGLMFHLKYSEAISFGLDVHKGRLSGQKKAFFNSRFVNNFVSIEFIPRWDLIRGLSWDPERKWSLQLYTGIGLSIFSAEAFHLSSGERIRFTNDPETSGRNALFKKYGTPIRKMGVRKTHERIVPVGFAPGYRLTKSLDIGMDIRFHFARTDKMDATSGYRLINPEEAESYSNTPNDIYSSTTIFLKYRFLKK